MQLGMVMTLEVLPPSYFEFSSINGGRANDTGAT